VDGQLWGSPETVRACSRAALGQPRNRPCKPRNLITNFGPVKGFPSIDGAFLTHFPSVPSDRVIHPKIRAVRQVARPLPYRAVILSASECGRRPKAPRPPRLSSVLPEIAPNLPRIAFYSPTRPNIRLFPFKASAGLLHG
jgi:hypothetical protein